MNITHEHEEYMALREKQPPKSKNNGCWYYSNEIVKNIIPRVKTNREWNTVGRDLTGMHDGMIVILHDNSTPWNYEWLKKYKDLVLVCSSDYTARSVAYSGHVIFVPMSIDTSYVRKFKAKKTRETCFVGNWWVRKNLRRSITGEVDFLSGLDRQELLEKLARYKQAYAIDRCALEAKCLGCKLLPIQTRYGCTMANDPEVLDNRDAAKILQRELDRIDLAKAIKATGGNDGENRIQSDEQGKGL